MLDYLLTALKIAGVIGAFLGVANLPDKSPNADQASRKQRKRKMALASMALLVAVGAEVVDLIAKKQDAVAQAERYYRLTHPLGTIQIDADISLKVTKSFSDYAKQLQEWNDSQPNDVPNPSQDLLPLPNRKLDPHSYSLLQHPALITIALFRTPISPQKGNTVIPDLEFSVPESASVERSPVADQTPLATPTDYSAENKTLIIEEAAMQNLPSSRFSTGQITAANDLLGSQIAVEICPLKLDFFNDVGFTEEFDEFAKSVDLVRLTFSLPGRHQLFDFNTQDSGVTRVVNGDCKTYYYTITSNQTILQQRYSSE